MREIKFRAKSVDSNSWIYGFYIYYITSEEGEVHSIIDSIGRWVTINPQTLGQFIKRNKDGKELYEGDILEAHGDKMMLVYSEGSYIARSLTKHWNNYYFDAYIKYKKIGNRYDNSELL